MRGIQILTIFCAVLGFALANDGETSLIDLQLNRCLGKDRVFLPIPGRCTQYIICVEGTAIIGSCGEYHFDAGRSVCDLPAKAGCISFGPELVNVCSGQRDGIKLPVPGNSSNYYMCAMEKPILQSCGQLQFDEKTMQCININGKPSAPQISSCYGVANGVKLPVAGNSRQYHLCMNNEAFLKDCGNMYFVAKYSACALAPEKTIPVSVVLAPQKLPSQHDLLLQRLCRNQRTGARVARPGSCSDYYVCMGHTAIPKSCGKNQFNPINTLCDLPSNVRCHVRANEVFYGTQDTLFRPNTEKSTSTQICAGQRDGIFLPVPGKCSDFYFCYKDQSFNKTCGSSRHFSPITLSCVELHESNCVDGEQATVEVSDVPQNNCLGRANGAFLRHPTQCEKFIICDNHNPVEMNCPAGLHFNLELSVCDWPETAKCVLV